MFPAGMTNASFSISIIDDSTLEQNETFVLTMDTSSDFTTVHPDKAVVTILDDDSKGTVF